MNARTTTITTALSAAVVGALAFGATGPAGAVTPTPAPSASVTPVVSATPTAPATARPTTAPTATTAPTTSPRPTATLPAPVITPTAIPTPTPTPTPVVPLPVIRTLDKHVGHTTASRTATVTGSNLLNLAAVRINGITMPDLVVQSATRAQFTIPSEFDYQPRVAAVTTTAYSDATARPTGFTFAYMVTSRLDKQMAYAFKYWNAYSSARFGYLAGSDCANFASQTLLARGWTRSSQWFNYGAGDWSGTWVSSTALSGWLKKRTDLATHLTYSQRDEVAVGDVVQFRWPGHSKTYSSWDHTGIVSKVVVLPDGHHDIYYTSHTLNRQYGGSTAGLAAWYAKQKIKGSTLRIQFFHLRK